MPNKTIYVSDADLPLFERAAELAAGNLSGAIAAAVREYVRSAETVTRNQYRPITVTAGPAGQRRRLRFTAVVLAEWSRPAGGDGLAEVFTGYGTARQRYAVYRRITSDYGRGEDRGVQPGRWAGASAGPANAAAAADAAGAAYAPGAAFAAGAADADAAGEVGEATLDVCDTLDQLAEHTPPEFARLMISAGAGLEIEDLDI